MIKTKEYVDVYKANDGKIFLTEFECQEYEKLKNIVYFSIEYQRDLCETGLFTKHLLVAVLPDRDYSGYPLVFNYALIVVCNGKYLQEDVMGYGYSTTFEIQPVKRLAENDKIDIFISDMELKGFPKPFNYKKEWGLK